MIGDFLDPQHSYQPSVELLRTQKYVAGPLKNYFDFFAASLRVWSRED